MKLDKIDEKLLFELSKNARLPETKLAKELKVSKEVVRYRMKKLEQGRIIQSYTIWIDVTKLGFQSAKIYLDLTNKPKRKREFINYVNSDKRLFWLGIAEGTWNAGLTYFVKDNKEFFEIKNKILEKFNDIIINTKTASVVSVNWCERNYLSSTQSTVEWNTIFEKREQIEIDKLSKHVLRELQQNARIRMSTIAEKYNTTIDVIRGRMKKLEKQGIIARYTIDIDHKKLGHEFYKTFCYFKRFSKKDQHTFFEFIKHIPEVIHVVVQISPWDIEIETMASSYEEYHQILSKITEEFADIIHRTETAIMREDYIFPAKKMIFE